MTNFDDELRPDAEASRVICDEVTKQKIGQSNTIGTSIANANACILLCEFHNKFTVRWQLQLQGRTKLKF